MRAQRTYSEEAVSIQVKQHAKPEEGSGEGEKIVAQDVVMASFRGQIVMAQCNHSQDERSSEQYVERVVEDFTC